MSSGVRGHLNPIGAAAAYRPLHLSGQRFNFRSTAIQLYEQDRGRVVGIAGVRELLRRLNRKLVHHFHTGRDDAPADDVGDRITGGFDAVKRSQHHHHFGRFW